MNGAFRKIELEMRRWIAAGDFPGGVVCVAQKGSIVYLKAFGNSVISPQKISARTDTVYDVASLTKPLVTATAILILIQQGKLSLETRLGDLFSRCPDDKKGITIADLLLHRSGIIDWYPLFACGSSIEEYVGVILDLPLAKPPREEAIYSCPGYVMLAAAIEKIIGKPFLEAAEELVIQPLGLSRTSLGKVKVSLEEVAATEEGSLTEREKIVEFDKTFQFREGVIWGESHDTNSWTAGGSAGNAGLFTTAEEALILSEQYGPRSTLISPDILALVGKNETPFGPQHRTLGWQLASSPESSAGPDLSPDSIGHTGFTGCSLWFDRLRDLTVILLTNRVHPHFSNADLANIRRKLSSLQLESFLL